MHWLSTASAWFSISLLFIIAMYMLKKRYEPTSISSGLLWRKAMLDREANKPWQKLKQRLLLWLQLIVAAMIVLALMEPVVMKQLARDSHIVVLLDRSTSMVTTTDQAGDSYFNKAKQELVEWLEDEFDGGAFTLVVNGDYPTILLNRSQSLSQIEQTIMGVKPYYGISDDATALSLVRALAQEEENTSLHYYIDHSFKVAELDLQQQADIVQEVWHRYGRADDLRRDDRIRSFTLTSGDHGVRAFITVLHENSVQSGNQLAEELEQLELTIHVHDERGELLDERTISSYPEKAGITTLQVDGVPPGYYYVAELKQRTNDPNIYNNKEFGLISEQATARALLVSDGNLFLEKALQLMDVEVTKLAPHNNAPNQQLIEGIKFLIVDGSYDDLVKDSSWESLLESYPLWIIDHPTAADGAQLVQKSPIVYPHEVTTYFSMEDIYISSVRSFNTSELSDYDVLVEYGGAPAMLAGFNQQRPFLRYGFALQDSDLPLRATFPILMMQSIQYMISGSSQQLGSMLVGSTPTLTLQSQTDSSYWSGVMAYASNAEAEADVKAASEQVFLGEDTIIAPEWPGIYELVEQDQAGHIIQKRIAIVQTDGTEFTSIHAGDSVKDDALPQTEGEPLQSYGWSTLIPWLAALMLLLLLCEWEVYRRGL